MIKFSLGLIFIPFLIIVIIAIVVTAFQTAPWIGLIAVIALVAAFNSSKNKAKVKK